MGPHLLRRAGHDEFFVSYPSYFFPLGGTLRAPEIPTATLVEYGLAYTVTVAVRTWPGSSTPSRYARVPIDPFSLIPRVEMLMSLSYSMAS